MRIGRRPFPCKLLPRCRAMAGVLRESLCPRSRTTPPFRCGIFHRVRRSLYLKTETSAECEHAVSGGGVDLAEAGVIYCRYRTSELRMIQYIERIHSQFEALAFA